MCRVAPKCLDCAAERAPSTFCVQALKFDLQTVQGERDGLRAGELGAWRRSLPNEGSQSLTQSLSSQKQELAHALKTSELVAAVFLGSKAEDEVAVTPQS